MYLLRLQGIKCDPVFLAYIHSNDTSRHCTTKYPFVFQIIFLTTSVSHTLPIVITTQLTVCVGKSILFVHAILNLSVMV
jgi:hypothetical protein